MLRRTRKLLPICWLASALVLALVVAACGGSGGSTSTAATTGASTGGSSTAATTGATTSQSSTGGSSKASGPSSVTVKSAKVGSYGTILVDSKGMTLYVFAPDNGKKVTCDSDCQSVWPPAVAPASGNPTAGPGVKQSLLGALPNPATGGRIITYHGWPLYTYVSDHGPGQATGQNLDLNGGYWWVIRTDGTIVH